MTEPNKCACGHVAFGHDDGRGECFTSGCKCRTLTEPTDLDALEARAKTRQAIDSPDVLALIAELRQEREQANADVQRLAEAFNENLALKAELRQERERASDLEGAYNSAVERHRLAAEKRDEYQQLYGDMADDERRARAALSRAEETIEKVARYVGIPGGKGAWLSGYFPDGIRAIITEYDKQSNEREEKP